MFWQLGDCRYLELDLATLFALDFMQIWYSGHRNIVLFFDCVGVARLLRIWKSIRNTLSKRRLDALVHETVLIYGEGTSIPIDFNLLLKLDIFVHLGDLMLLQIFKVQDWNGNIFEPLLLLLLLLFSLLRPLHFNLFEEIDLFRVDAWEIRI